MLGFWSNIAPEVQKKATALTSVGEEADDIGKGSGRGKRGQASNPEAKESKRNEAHGEGKWDIRASSRYVRIVADWFRSWRRLTNVWETLPGRTQLRRVNDER